MNGHYLTTIINRLRRNRKTDTMFVQLLLNAVKTAASLELAQLLEKFKEHNSEQDYNDLVTALQKSFGLLKKVADQTKTKVDDTVVGIVLNALPTE